MLFAKLAIDPGSAAAWLVIGLILGWLAGKLVGNPSYGVMGDVLLGAIGGVVGGALAGLFASGDPAFWVACLVALVGACVFIGVARIVVALRSA